MPSVCRRRRMLRVSFRKSAAFRLGARSSLISFSARLTTATLIFSMSASLASMSLRMRPIFSGVAIRRGYLFVSPENGLRTFPPMDAILSPRGILLQNESSPRKMIDYRQDGGDGPHLLLLHSLLTELTVFDRMIPELAAKRRVTRLNLPGFGRSSPKV